jgi:hypothetical protein
VSVSRIISRRAAAINKASSNSESPERSWSLESGADSDRVFDVKLLLVSGKFLEQRFAIGRIHEVKNSATDFVR